MTALAPFRPHRGPTVPAETARRYLAAARAALHPDPFPGVTARHAVDQALAATERRQ